VLFSLVHLVVRWLPGVVVVLCRGEVSKDVELLVLRHKNAVLRRQVPHSRYRPADRFWLAALSRLVLRCRRPAMFPVTPATLLRWHRRLVARKWTCTGRRRRGRPPAVVAVRKLILPMARDNPAWGHRRILWGSITGFCLRGLPGWDPR
jgi:putative transposase